MSHTKSKVPKRALWNESKIKPHFTHHRVYNLLGAKVTLLPEGLAKKRHWSKKYPICVTLHKDQMDFETPPTISMTSIRSENDDNDTKRSKFDKKKKYSMLSQRFSKLTEENEELDLDSENSRASSPSPLSPDDSVSRELKILIIST